MGIIGALYQLWQGFNGKKFNTGAAVTILSLAFLKAFAAFGMTPDAATSDATYIVGAVGVVIMLVGYVHQWIKAHAAAKVLTVASSTGTEQK
jgi:hypothetical protein